MCNEIVCCSVECILSVLLRIFALTELIKICCTLICKLYYIALCKSHRFEKVLFAHAFCGKLAALYICAQVTDSDKVTYYCAKVCIVIIRVIVCFYNTLDKCVKYVCCTANINSSVRCVCAVSLPRIIALGCCCCYIVKKLYCVCL